MGTDLNGNFDIDLDHDCEEYLDGGYGEGGTHVICLRCAGQRGEVKKEETEPTPSPAPVVRSWAVEVIADTSGKWCGNSLRFASEEVALRYGRDLASRWLAVSEVRVVPSEEEVNS